jgi:hypothetical protein
MRGLSNPSGLVGLEPATALGISTPDSCVATRPRDPGGRTNHSPPGSVTRRACSEGKCGRRTRTRFSAMWRYGYDGRKAELRGTHHQRLCSRSDLGKRPFANKVDFQETATRAVDSAEASLDLVPHGRRDSMYAIAGIAADRSDRHARRPGLPGWVTAQNA